MPKWDANPSCWPSAAQTRLQLYQIKSICGRFRPHNQLNSGTTTEDHGCSPGSKRFEPQILLHPVWSICLLFLIIRFVFSEQNTSCSCFLLAFKVKKSQCHVSMTFRSLCSVYMIPMRRMHFLTMDLCIMIPNTNVNLTFAIKYK